MIISFDSENIIVIYEEEIYLIYLLNDFQEDVVEPKRYTILGKQYMGGIKISNNIIAFISNKMLLNGENKMIFYDKKAKKSLNKIDIIGYSYTISKGNFLLLSIPKEYRRYNNNEDKLLLCGCKKYDRDKNGILFLSIEIDENFVEIIHEHFFNIRNFQVYFFHPIKKQKRGGKY